MIRRKMGSKEDWASDLSELVEKKTGWKLRHPEYLTEPDIQILLEALGEA